MTTFGERLRSLRDEKDLSQEELGKILNLSQSTIAYYETSKKEPTKETMERMADFFGVSLDYLFGRTNIRTISPSVAETPAHYTPEVQAAHRTDDPTDELPEEARKTIEEFKAFVLERHKKTP